MLSAFTAQAAATQDLARAIWIDLRQPTDTEISAVAEATGLRVPTEAEVSEIEASSRLVLRGKRCCIPEHADGGP